MSERNPVRDRTLILRVLVPSLEARLRDKMKEAEDAAAATAPPGNNTTDYLTKETLCDLDGVTCEPTSDGSTRWNFHIDGASYPARLVNLPCPVELHKTHDHAMYYKSCDIAQLLVVYEDEMAMEESESMPGYKFEEYPSYYHSGITPPLKRVVERRFSKREHKAVPPPRTEVSEIEEALKDMIDRISDSTKGKARGNANNANKVIEEVEDEIVDFEPWMDDYGRNPKGVEFDTDDPRFKEHPEIWLEPREVKEIVDVELEKEDKKAQAAAKKEEKKKAKKKKSAEADRPKKNVNAKTNNSQIDEVTQAAAGILKTKDGELDLDDFINSNEFDFGDDEVLDFGGMDVDFA